MKIFACAARIKLYSPLEFTVFCGLVEANFQEEAEQKFIKYLNRAFPDGDILIMVVTDRYFNEKMSESEKNHSCEDFPIND